MLPTCDPSVFIESVESGSIIYIASETGERWRIDGECNRCGACWEGAVNPAPLLDCPVRPEIKEKFPDCTLSGEYLKGE